MATDRSIVMPKLGLTMTEGVVSEWKVAPGDTVQVGDVLFIAETDKIANEIEATEAGVIAALHVAQGETVAVGVTVATYAGADGAVPSSPASTEVAAAAEVTPPAETAKAAHPAKTAPASHRQIATPLARRLAANAGLDLAAVAGSGPRGRIQAKDIASAIESGTASAPAAAAPAPANERPAAPAGQVAAQGVVHPLGAYQKVAARRLTEAKRDIPHFYVFAQADVTELLALRTRLNADAQFAKLTVNHFLLAATARALGQIPAMNRVFVSEGMLEFAQIDVGLAVEGQKGLVAPVLRDLGGLSVDEVALAATALVERARKGALAPGDLAGGAITISNVGMFGATGLIPIVNPGQSSILGVGANRPEYRPDAQDQPQLRQILDLSLSCDHRVIDGALAARFIHQIQIGLEAPLTLLRRAASGGQS